MVEPGTAVLSNKDRNTDSLMIYEETAGPLYFENMSLEKDEALVQCAGAEGGGVKFSKASPSDVDRMNFDY